MVTVWVALGSNLGDRERHLTWAIEHLRPVLERLRCSSFVNSAPEGVPDSQPDYLNAVVTGETSLGPHALFAVLMDLEQQRGRDRRMSRGARTLDLDLLFYGEQQIQTPDLVVPHPRFRDRWFVLAPMAELEPLWRDPVTGKTVETLLADLAVQTTGAKPT